MFLEHIRSLDSSGRLHNDDEIRRNDPVALAYLGDTLYDLYVRSRLMLAGDYKAGRLHQLSVPYVCAAGQAVGLEAIASMLNDVELDIARRARNAKTSPPKNCDPAVYSAATSFEAVCGYLYLCGQEARLLNLFDRAYEAVAKQQQGE